MPNKGKPEELFVLNFYIGLIIVQTIFLSLWLTGKISWHWGYVFLPTWILVGLPLLASVLIMLGVGKERKIER